MKVVLTTLNASYIHKNLALRWLFVSRPADAEVQIREYTIKDDLARLTGEIVQLRPEAIGISVYIWNAEATKHWVVLLREALPEVRIVLGGPEVTYASEDWFDVPIDAIVKGEGEQCFWQGLAGQPAVGWATAENYAQMAVAKVDLAWLETLESPYYLPMDIEQMERRYLYLETARGCPYRCSYCLSSADPEIRTFSLAYIERQLQPLHHLKVKQVKFLDRTFNANPRRALRIAEMLEQLPPHINVQMEIVAETLSPELLAFFSQAQASRYRFEIGVQSFHPPTLAAVGRLQDAERLRTVVKRLRDDGYTLHLDLIAGLPYEDLVTFAESYRQVFALRPQEIQVGILKLLKGTRLRSEQDQYRIRSNREAPYAVAETAWLAPADLRFIEEVALATEKCWNHGLYRPLIEDLETDGKLGDPFAWMAEVGRAWRQLPHPYQPDEAAQLLVAHLQRTLPAEEALARVNTSYACAFVIKPKLLPEALLPLTQRKTINQWLVTHGFNLNDVYQKSRLEWGWHNDMRMIQWLVYHPGQKPKRYWIQWPQAIIEEEAL